MRGCLGGALMETEKYFRLRPLGDGGTAIRDNINENAIGKGWKDKASWEKV